jgi:methylated-DNA-protein-cysteine methyltransferase-like protein
MSSKRVQDQEQSYYKKVYELVRQVPAGYVVTYGQIAGVLGDPRRARTVGWAMRACPEDVPWHRVVNAKGGLSTRSAWKGFHPQRALLEDEGVAFDDDGLIDLESQGWRYGIAE